MAYKNLIGITTSNRADVFKHFRDFVCARNGSYDYSLTGIGWTLFDSNYAVDEHTISLGDWFVIYSPGENGQEDLYFKISNIANYIKIEGFLYWNAATNAGVQQYNTASNWYILDTAVPILWVYGSLDAIIPVIRTTSVSTSFYLTPFGKGISLYDDTIAVSAAAIAAGTDVVVDVGTVPPGAGWDVGKKLFIRDTARVDIITIKAVTASTITIDAAYSYLAGAKIAADLAYYCSSGYQTVTSLIALITHSGAKSQGTGGAENGNAVATNCGPDPLNSDHVFESLYSSSSTYGYLCQLQNIKKCGGSITSLSIVANVDGYNYRAFPLMSGYPVAIREV